MISKKSFIEMFFSLHKELEDLDLEKGVFLHLLYFFWYVFFFNASLPKNYFRLKKKISYKLLWCIKKIWYILKILRCLITLCDLDVRFRTSSWLCDLICMLFNFLIGRNCVSLNTKVHIHACSRHVMIFNWNPKKQ